MSSAGRTGTVGVEVEEKSSRCETGGGFEKIVWRIRVNDGWLRLDQMLWRGTLGGVTAELLDEEDPYGEASNGWSDRPPEVWWKRVAYVTAPVGTRFWRRLWVPDRERARVNPLLPSMPYEKLDTFYQLRATGLVREDVIAERRRARAVAVVEKPMTFAEIAQQAALFAAKLRQAG